MELVLEIMSEPWTPAPFNLIVDLWIICGRKALPKWLRKSVLEIDGPNSDTRRWERAKAAMEHVRKIVLKELDDERLVTGSGAGGLAADS